MNPEKVFVSVVMPLLDEEEVVARTLSEVEQVLEGFTQTYEIIVVDDGSGDGTFAEVMGEGDMDYAAIGKALHEVDFTGYAVIELATPRKQQTRSMRESLKISRQYVRTTMGY